MTLCPRTPARGVVFQPGGPEVRQALADAPDLTVGEWTRRLASARGIDASPLDDEPSEPLRILCSPRGDE